MTATIHVLPGVERRDLAGEPTPSEQILRSAIDNGLHDVVVIGLDRFGMPYIASSMNDADRAAGRLMQAVQYLSGATVDHEESNSA